MGGKHGAKPLSLRIDISLSPDFQTGITNHHRLVGLLRDMKDVKTKLTNRKAIISLVSGKAVQFCLLLRTPSNKTPLKSPCPLASIALSPEQGKQQRLPLPQTKPVYQFAYLHASKTWQFGSGSRSRFRAAATMWLLEDPLPASETEAHCTWEEEKLRKKTT